MHECHTYSIMYGTFSFIFISLYSEMVYKYSHYIHFTIVILLSFCSPPFPLYATSSMIPVLQPSTAKSSVHPHTVSVSIPTRSSHSLQITHRNESYQSTPPRQSPRPGQSGFGSLSTGIKTEPFTISRNSSPITTGTCKSSQS